MVQKLNHYSMTNVASVYDEEALTAIELAARTAGKVNEVVEEVNKLPELVDADVAECLDSGRLERLIDAKIDNTIARVDNLLGQVTEGSTTLDAEIIDGRTTSGGASFDNIGDHIRSVENTVDAKITRYIGLNRLDPNACVSGYITPAGGVVTEGAYWTTSYISLAPGETIGLFNKNMSPIPMRFVAYYLADKTLSTLEGKTDVMTFTNPSSDIGFIRVSFPMKYEPSELMLSSYQAEEYAPFGQGALIESMIPEQINFIKNGHAYRNRFIKADITDNVYVSYSTGLEMSGATYFTTAYIKVTEGESLSVFDKNMNRCDVRMVAFYNLEGQVIAGGFAATTKVIAVPSGAYYMRASLKEDYLKSELMLAHSDAPLFCGEGDIVFLAEGATGSSIEAPTDVMTFHESSLVTGYNYGFTDYPRAIKRGEVITATVNYPRGIGKYLTIGKGKPDSEYGAIWVRVSEDFIFYGRCINGEVVEYQDPTMLDTTDMTYLSVTLETVSDDTVDGYQIKVTIQNDNDSYVYYFPNDVNFSTSGYAYGMPFASVDSVNISNLDFSITCRHFNSDIWLFGDSYYHFDTSRVCGALAANYGVYNYLCDSTPGQTSEGAYDELLKCLKYGRPKKIIWAVGLNDTVTNYEKYLKLVETLCDTYGITLILNKLPLAPGVTNTNAPAAINEIVVNSGRRYYDSELGINGQYVSDNVHPNTTGANGIAARMIAAVPELINT